MTPAARLTAPGMVLQRYDVITLDGATGQVLKGAVPTAKPEVSGDFARLLSWADEFRRMAVRANAETVQDARMAKDFGRVAGRPCGSASPDQKEAAYCRRKRNMAETDTGS